MYAGRDYINGERIILCYGRKKLVLCNKYRLKQWLCKKSSLWALERSRKWARPDWMTVKLKVVEERWFVTSVVNEIMPSRSVIG